MPSARARKLPVRLPAPLARQWACSIIAALLPGPLHFNQLRSKLEGISSKTLSNNLKCLEAEGLAARRITSTKPYRVEYELTVRGIDFARILEVISEWTARYAATDDPALKEEPRLLEMTRLEP